MTMSLEERTQLARDRLEELIAEFVDVFAPDAEMPMQSDWVLVTCHDDAADADGSHTYRLSRRGQWAHRSVGLLIFASDDYRSIVNDTQ